MADAFLSLVSCGSPLHRRTPCSSSVPWRVPFITHPFSRVYSPSLPFVVPRSIMTYYWIPALLYSLHLQLKSILQVLVLFTSKTARGALTLQFLSSKSECAGMSGSRTLPFLFRETSLQLHLVHVRYRDSSGPKVLRSLRMQTEGTRLQIRMKIHWSRRTR